MAKQTQVLAAFVLGAVIVAGALYGTGYLAQITPAGQQQANLTADQINAAKISALCGDDAKGELRLAAFNPLSTTTTKYLNATARIYNPDGQFTGTIAVTSAGLPSEGSGTSCAACGKDYTYVVVGSDGVATSASGKITCKDGAGVVFQLPEQAGLLFKVRDEENYAYVYGGTETTAGNLLASGTTFASVTSNSSNRAIGADESYDYTIWTEINKTAATDKQFTDLSLLIAINGQDLSDWAKPSVSVAGASVADITCPTKISNDGYDWCWEVTTSGSTPLVISGDFVKINVQQQSLPGVNPSDDIQVGLFTSGIYKHTLDEGYSSGYNKDDSTKTYVFTGQTVTFAFD